MIGFEDSKNSFLIRSSWMRLLCWSQCCFFVVSFKNTPGGFHAKDIDRIKSTDIWLQRFLEQQDLDPKASLDMLWETCEWRKKFAVNGLYFKLWRHKTNEKKNSSMNMWTFLSFQIPKT